MDLKNYFSTSVAQAFIRSEKYMANGIGNYATMLDRPLSILDVGCGTGKKTKFLISRIPKKQLVEVHGIDIFPKSKLVYKKIKYKKVNVENERYPFKAGSFDIILCNQVIEHLLDKDFMLAEIHRVLKKGGMLILATENISSIDNILSLILGQEPVTQVTSSKYRTNSILSTSYMKKEPAGNIYEHKNVNSYFGLKRMLEVNSFKKPYLKSFGNINRFFEFAFPIYNKVLTITSVKK